MLMKKGLETYSSIQLASLRITIVFLVLFPIAIRQLKLLNTKYLKWFIATSLFGNGIPAFLFAKAQVELNSSLAGMLNSLTPLFALIIGYLFFRSKSTWRKIIGVLVGLAGSASIIYFSNNIAGGNYEYSFLVIIATFCYGMSVNILKHKLHTINSIAITALAFLFIGPPCLFYLLLATDFSSIVFTQQGLIGLGYISVLAVVGTALAVITFNELIKHTSSVFATSVTYLIPIVAILWGVLDGETIHIVQLILFSVILFSVYIVNTEK